MTKQKPRIQESVHKRLSVLLCELEKSTPLVRDSQGLSRAKWNGGSTLAMHFNMGCW